MGRRGDMRRGSTAASTTGVSSRSPRLLREPRVPESSAVIGAEGLGTLKGLGGFRSLGVDFRGL